MIIFFRYFSIYSMEEIIIFSIKIIFINDMFQTKFLYQMIEFSEYWGNLALQRWLS